MLRRCLRNTTQHYNTISSTTRIHHLTFSCLCIGQRRDSQAFARSKHHSTSKHLSNSFRRLHGRHLTKNYSHGLFITARNASTSGTANAAYAAEQAARESRQKQIIQLVEKKVRQREKLVEEVRLFSITFLPACRITDLTCCISSLCTTIMQLNLVRLHNSPKSRSQNSSKTSNLYSNRGIDTPLSLPPLHPPCLF
jgi:hypothetical protein